MSTNKDSTKTVEDMNRKPLEGEVINQETVKLETEYNLTVANKFYEAFNNDYNITQACQYAGVSRQTFYNWLEQHPDFKLRVDEAKAMPLRRAREVIIKAIDEGDSNLAIKYLQARDPEFKSKVQIDPGEKLNDTRNKIKDFLDEPSDYGTVDSSTGEAEPDAASTELAGGTGEADGSEVATTTPDIS